MHILLKHRPASERPYRCEHCPDVGYARKWHLEQHNMHHHQTERNHVCALCGKAYKGHIALRNHERDVHKIGLPKKAKMQKEKKEAKHFNMNGYPMRRRYTTPEIIKK